MSRTKVLPKIVHPSAFVTQRKIVLHSFEHLIFYLSTGEVGGRDIGERDIQSGLALASFSQVLRRRSFYVKGPSVTLPLKSLLVT